MNTITLPWEARRAIIAALRASGLLSKRDYADELEQQREQHAPGQARVTLHLTDDVFLRSSNGARWQLGIPLPPD